MTMLEEIVLLMITAPRTIATEIIMLVETTLPMINVLRLLETEMVMLADYSRQRWSCS